MTRVGQSNLELFLRGELDIDVYVTENISGSGNRRKTFKAPIDDYDKAKAKKSVITIKNNDK